jgi:hypothetical protein
MAHSVPLSRATVFGPACVSSIVRHTLQPHINMKTLFIIISLAFVSVGIGQTTNGPGPSQTQSAPLITRTYQIEAFMNNVKHLMPPKNGESDFQLLLRFFKQNEIEIKKPELVFMNHKQHELYVRATQTDQDKIGALIAKVQSGK